MKDRLPDKNDEKRKVFWFQVSGFVGTALFYFFYEFVLSTLTRSLALDSSLWNSKASIAWTFSNVVSIVWMHALHRYLVYGPVKPYFSTLIATYVAYGVTIVLTHFMMMGLERLEVGEKASWLINILGGGVVNYFLVSKANS